MPGPTTTTTTNVSKTELPQWVNDAGKANYDKAVSLDNSPLEQFAGPRVAAPSADTKAAFNFFKTHMGDGSADTSSASDIFRGLGDPSRFSSGVQGFLNPWISNVEDAAIGRENDALTQTLQGNADAAIKAKAFGGSRAAITDGVTRSETAKNIGELSANLRASGFDKASSAYMQSQQTSGQGLLSTGDQKMSQMLKQFAGLEDIGQNTDAYNQKEIDANMSKFNESRDKELNDLNVRLSALGMTPYDKTASNTGTSTTPPDYGAMGIGLLSLLAGMV